MVEHIFYSNKICLHGKVVIKENLWRFSHNYHFDCIHCTLLILDLKHYQRQSRKL
jgi:hypothetical protein